jgi:hypothetical protein
MRSADRWLAPTLAEFESFVAEGVWRIPDIDPALIPLDQIMPSMLVYDEQFYPDGSWKKDKCRLVGRGDVLKRMFTTENYSGTVRPEAVRMMLGTAAEMDLEMACVDAKTAFLNSPVEEGVVMYMRRPPGVPDSLMPEIVQLQKYIYGLPQASKKFREHSDRTLRALGFIPNITDPCVYTKKVKGEYIFVTVHVDDFGIMAPTKALVQATIEGLARTYKLVITPDLKFYLGLNIARDRVNRTITLSQDGYVEEFLDTYGIIPSASTNFPLTPMASTETNPRDETPFKMEQSLFPILSPPMITLYQAKVGSLNYLAGHTRPDILFAVTMASRRNQSPTMRERHGSRQPYPLVCGRHKAPGSPIPQWRRGASLCIGGRVVCEPPRQEIAYRLHSPHWPTLR